MRVERLRQRLAAAHIVADRLQQVRDRHRGRQRDQHLERAIERQSGTQQRRELARDREQVIARDAPRREPAAARTGPGLRRAQLRVAASRRHDLHRHQPLVAQPVDDLGFVGGLQLAGGDVTGGVDRLVAI